MRSLWLLLLLGLHLGHAQRSDFKGLDFSAADSIAMRLQGAGLENLPVLVHQLTTGVPTDVEKFRAIYTWISTNIANDYYGYLKTTKKRKKLAKDSLAFLAWNKNYVPKVFEKLITEKKTACTGYAFLVREMASLSGIECVMVSGYGRTPNLFLKKDSPPNHSWNAVKLNKKWYLCDATWSAGVTNFEDGKPVFKQEYYDGYFLADPNIFIKNHFPLDTQWSLMTAPPSFQEFLAGPVVYKDASALGVLPLSPQNMNIKVTKNDVLEFTFQLMDEFVIEKTDLLVSSGNSSTPVIPIVHREGGIYIVSHRFKKAGFFDVHLRADGRIIATYVVRVKRK